MTSSETLATAVQRVWIQLADRFARLIGHGGIRTLQERSVSVVAVRRTWMSTPDEGFGADWTGLRTAFEGRAVMEAVEGFEELVAALLALLARFIGDALVGALLHEMWPGVFPVTQRS